MASQINDRLSIIYFVPPDHPANSMVQAVIAGWYLAITYREAFGSVVHYHLSNAHINLNLPLFIDSSKGNKANMEQIWTSGCLCSNPPKMNSTRHAQFAFGHPSIQITVQA
jgi:hypothetical protein